MTSTTDPAPITIERLSDLLGDGWLLHESKGRWHTFRLPLRGATTDHVYCEAKVNPTVTTIRYGVEHDCELIAVTGSILKQHPEDRRDYGHLWGRRTFAAHGPVYGTWAHCLPGLVEEVVIPTVLTLADAARQAVRQIEEGDDQ